MIKVRRHLDFTVTTVGGVGHLPQQIDGDILSTSITFAGGEPIYDYDIVDGAGKGVTGREKKSGNITVTENKPCNGLSMFTIANTTIDGDFSVRLYMDSEY